MTIQTVRNRLVWGVGINDVYEQGFYKTTCYKKWQDVLRRSCNEEWKEKKPMYRDCTLDPRWHRASAFKEWYDTWEDPDSKHIDKDILIPGNMVYGPDTCLMVSSLTNSWFRPTDITKSKGDKTLPRGVCANKEYTKFRSQINEINGVNRRHLGWYNTPEEAYEVFDKARKEQIKIIFEMEEDSRIKNALRQYL
jgi:hypothetical protein